MSAAQAGEDRKAAGAAESSLNTGSRSAPARGLVGVDERSSTCGAGGRVRARPWAGRRAGPCRATHAAALATSERTLMWSVGCGRAGCSPAVGLSAARLGRREVFMPPLWRAGAHPEAFECAGAFHQATPFECPVQCGPFLSEPVMAEAFFLLSVWSRSGDDCDPWRQGAQAVRGGVVAGDWAACHRANSGRLATRDVAWRGRYRAEVDIYKLAYSDRASGSPRRQHPHLRHRAQTAAEKPGSSPCA